MDSIKVILSSNRGSYNEGSVISSGFEMLSLEISAANNECISGVTESNELNRFMKTHSAGFILGYLGYELGYQSVEKKASGNKTLNDVPGVWLVAVDEKQVQKTESAPKKGPLPETKNIQLQQLVSRNKYFEKVTALKKHIQLGDVYEINYCIPFVAENVELDPKIIWERLQQISPMPFAAFIDHPEFAIISASPERFIKKQDDQIFIQPMKGTIARGKNEEKDKRNQTQLKEDKKERAENVMIVDLTRNDLSKIAKKGSVKVDELFGVYTFKSVHQMVSTVSCKVRPEISFGEILEATFPMGSMTGAPKKRAMQLIEEYEDFARGPFSGMLGYMEPGGNFDFSVMIRTIFYSKREKKLFMAVGSAITSGSDVEKEYEECLIKLQPLLQALNATII